jgi:hypothetical protein
LKRREVSVYVTVSLLTVYYCKMDRATDRNELANVIRGLHKKLRKEFKRTGDVESLWMEHMKDENKLKVCKSFR